MDNASPMRFVAVSPARVDHPCNSTFVTADLGTALARLGTPVGAHARFFGGPERISAPGLAERSQSEDSLGFRTVLG